MKILLPNDSKQGLGGGWTFRRNFQHGLEMLGHEVVYEVKKADIILLAGTTMITKDTMQFLKDSGKKIVVRLDNVPRNSRNRNTGTSYLKRFSEMADAIVWQSNWSKEYLERYINRRGVIIYNAVNENIFKPDGAYIDFKTPKEDVYLYSRYSRDETKNWEVAWYDFQEIARQNKFAKLVIVGQFSLEHLKYNFDFFQDEQIEYMNVVSEPDVMARIMRGCGKLLATYYNDAFSNTYLEALACGMELVNVNMTGGTPEILDLWKEKGRDYFSLERMTKGYLQLFTELLS